MMNGERRVDGSAEERAEAMMERVTSETARFFGRVVGRAREELEDMVAEARTITHGDKATSRAGRGTRSGE